MSHNYNYGPPPGQQQQYPPQGGYPPPQQAPYGQGPPPNQGYGGYNQGPPPNQQWNQGYQQQGYQQQGYGGYNQGPPPPGQYNQQPYPPQGHQGGPPPPQGNYGPPQGGYGAPPPGQQGYGPPPGAPVPPSPGYVAHAAPDGPGFNAHDVAKRLRAAMKGFGTDENALIKNLAHLTPDQVVSVKNSYHQSKDIGRNLMNDVHGETSGYFRDGLEGIIRGPLEQDVHQLHQSIKGLGTKESAMNDVLLSRSNADLNAIKQQYQKTFGHSLESDVKGDLSLKTERLFDMVMAARRQEETAPVIPQQVDADVQELYRATEGQNGTDEIAVCQVISSKSDNQLRAISQAYKGKYHRSLDEVIRKEFSGHMEQALVYMLHHAEDPAKLDADMLEESMKGAGTKDSALVRRIIAVHWNPERLRQCKAAYKHFYKQELATRIKGETSGDYEKLMVECIEQPYR